MSIENAKKFVQMVNDDETFKERVENLSSDEVLAFAKDQGLDFTADELQNSLGITELSLEDMDNVAGGLPKPKYGPCPNSPDKKHHWVVTGHIEEPHKFLWMDYTQGYNFEKCSYCGMERKKRT